MVGKGVREGVIQSYRTRVAWGLKLDKQREKEHSHISLRSAVADGGGKQ